MTMRVVRPKFEIVLLKKRGTKKWDDPLKMKGIIILKIKFKGTKEVTFERRQ